MDLVLAAEEATTALPRFDHRIRRVESFHALLTTPFAEGVHALCWPRTLAGDFAEVVALLGAVAGGGAGGGAGTVCGDGDSDGAYQDEPLVTLDDDRLRELATRASPAGQLALAQLRADLALLRAHGLEPVLNCIYGYPRDDLPGPVATDVFSFHADSATVPTDTWLCTYHGSPSEGLRHEDAVRRVDQPATRAELLRLHGGADDADFTRFLSENCYDLHYAPQPGALPYSFGVGHLWRIAVDYPGSPVPPCVHRAPLTIPGQPRLLLIS